MKSLVSVLLVVAGTLVAQADERVRPRAELLREGYRAVPVAHGAATPVWLAIAAHSLPWPVRFEDDRHPIGNSMAEFQPFGSPYFHGGLDLRVRAQEPIFTPVGGRLEAGHYSYASNPDGSLTKMWMPWPQVGSATYFEVAVVTDDGTRFEFHHVDRARLPAEIVRLLDAGGTPRVEAGQLLGEAITWPGGGYHHTHYNVIAADGTRLNPEYLSPLVDDVIPPEIEGVYPVPATGRPTELVVATRDRQGDGRYEHPPVTAWLRFTADGKSTGWDFSRSLARADGGFPSLWSFFKESLTLADGTRLATSGGYGTGLSLVRLAVPAGASGGYQITVSDPAGNVTRRTGRIER